MNEPTNYNFIWPTFMIPSIIDGQKSMTKIILKLTAEVGVVASVPIDLQAAHFFKPTIKDRF